MRTQTNYSNGVQNSESRATQHKDGILAAGTVATYSVIDAPKQFYVQNTGTISVTDFGADGTGTAGVTVVYEVVAGHTFEFNGIKELGAVGNTANVVPQW